MYSICLFIYHIGLLTEPGIPKPPADCKWGGLTIAHNTSFFPPTLGAFSNCISCFCNVSFQMTQCVFNVCTYLGRGVVLIQEDPFLTPNCSFSQKHSASNAWLSDIITHPLIFAQYYWPLNVTWCKVTTRRLMVKSRPYLWQTKECGNQLYWVYLRSMRVFNLLRLFSQNSKLVDCKRVTCPTLNCNDTFKPPGKCCLECRGELKFSNISRLFNLMKSIPRRR